MAEVKQKTLSPSSSPARVLVVDDDIRNLELLEAYLSMEGHEVILARSGEEALDLVQQSPPDLILLDIMMPGLDGFEVCSRLKSDPKTQFIPIIMVTALRGTRDRIRGLDVGADDFISKPFNGYELLARVRSLLRIKRLHDELERKNALLYNILNRYMAEDVTAQILSDPDRFLKLGGESRLVTVFFADIRGFTNYAETHKPQQVVETLNAIFSQLTQVIYRWKGTFDKYLGDAIMAFYGAPVSHDNDALRAIQTALEMQQTFEHMKANWPNEDLVELGLGIGVHSGEAIVGNIGSERVMDYTVIGDTVNVARRLQEEAARGQILISEATYQLVREHVLVKKMPPHVLRGRQEPIITYEVQGLIAPLTPNSSDQ